MTTGKPCFRIPGTDTFTSYSRSTYYRHKLLCARGHHGPESMTVDTQGSRMTGECFYCGSLLAHRSRMAKKLAPRKPGRRRKDNRPKFFKPRPRYVPLADTAKVVVHRDEALADLLIPNCDCEGPCA